MCGITGTFDPDPERAEKRVRILNSLQHHRGPDHSAIVRAGSATLGYTRLAIQDPTPAGNQPYRTRDGRYVCVFNGEIYNWPELIERFSLKPQSDCDGAIIPELWERLGPACLEMFSGMFGIAVADTAEDTITLARDPFGIKPLYYRRFPDGAIGFASEPRSLAAIDPAPRLDPVAVARFLHLGAVAANDSPFEDVAALAPNERIVLDGSGIKQATAILPGRHPLLEAPGDSRLAESFKTSVDRHLRSDVPSALLLSSGFDSAAIAAAARTLGRNLHCVTVAGLGEENEQQGAGETARRYGHEHTVKAADIDEGTVQDFFAGMQRPTIDGLNTFLVCSKVRELGIKVALSGLGSDEILGGYRQFRLARRLRFAPGPLGRLASAALKVGSRSTDVRRSKATRILQTRSDTWHLDLIQRELFAPEIVDQLTGVDPGSLPYRYAPDGTTGLGRLAMTAAELALYLQPMLLPDADVFSMRRSVELRVPFLDVGFFGAVVQGTRGDRVSKRTLGGALEDEYLVALTKRRKRGFSLPMRSWMDAGALAPFIDAALRDDAPLWDHVDSKRGRAILKSDSPRWAEQWSLTVLNSWLASLKQERQVGAVRG